MKNKQSVRFTRASATKNAPSYDTPSSGLMCALILFPIPMIFVVLTGNYSPRQKMYWSLAAALETLASAVTALYTLYSLHDALSLL